MAMSTANADAILNALLRNVSFAGPAALFLSIHSSDPGATGASEFTNYTGTRPSVAFSAAASGTITSSNQQDYTSMGATTITHYGLWSAASGGTFQFGRPLDIQRTTDATGQTLRFLTSGITIPLAS
jgi:hypothetical protein